MSKDLLNYFKLKRFLFFNRCRLKVKTEASELIKTLNKKLETWA